MDVRHKPLSSAQRELLSRLSRCQPGQRVLRPNDQGKQLALAELVDRGLARECVYPRKKPILVYYTATAEGRRFMGEQNK